METIHERAEFERNIGYVTDYLKGEGLDMGCGRCPLLRDNCTHVDHSPQPLAVEQVGIEAFVCADAVNYNHHEKVDYIFSSHMVEDLESREAIIECLNKWSKMLKNGGCLVLCLPDMQNHRYSTVEEGGNPSHRVNVGEPFILDIAPELESLELEQINTIPEESSCTIDIVFKKTGGAI